MRIYAPWSHLLRQTWSVNIYILQSKQEEFATGMMRMCTMVEAGYEAAKRNGTEPFRVRNQLTFTNNLKLKPSLTLITQVYLLQKFAHMRALVCFILKNTDTKKKMGTWVDGFLSFQWINLDKFGIKICKDCFYYDRVNVE